jgi:hypothetical protein
MKHAEFEQEYISYISDVWEEYLYDRKVMKFNAMSMRQRDELLSDLRRDLDEIIAEKPVVSLPQEAKIAVKPAIDVDHVGMVYEEVKLKLNKGDSVCSTACLLAMVEDIVKPLNHYSKSRAGLILAAKDLKELSK